VSEGRQEILDLLRGESRSAAQIQQSLESIGPPTRLQLEAEDVIEAFVAQLLQNKVSVELANDRSRAVQCISSYLYKKHNSHRVVAGYDPRLAALPWRDGGVLVRFGAATSDDIASVSYARQGVAEAGAILLYSNRTNPASNNWLVEDQLVIVDTDDVVANYEDAWERIAKDRAAGEAPRGVHFIGGPSSTGDIIGHLVKGAHGPLNLHVVLRGYLDEDLRSRLQELISS
jgi:L-lactate dehydrogenase complex protein LldG